jgi:hypothetical protein
MSISKQETVKRERMKDGEDQSSPSFILSLSAYFFRVSAEVPAIAGASQGGTSLAILFLHFFVNNRVPFLRTFFGGYIVFAGPTPQTQLFDEVQLHFHYTTTHDTSPLQHYSLETALPKGWRRLNISVCLGTSRMFFILSGRLASLLSVSSAFFVRNA